MKDCIFCKISSGVFGTDFVYEDDLCVVFADLHPKSKTHLLIVSRKHIPSILDLKYADEEIVGQMVLCAKKVAEKLKLPGYKLQFNVGKEGGQEIFHIHLHLTSNY